MNCKYLICWKTKRTAEEDNFLKELILKKTLTQIPNITIKIYSLENGMTKVLRYDFNTIKCFSRIRLDYTNAL